MAAQTWSSIQTSVIVALAQAPSPYATTNIPDFNIQFPQAVSYAENRIYRDMVMLCQRQQNTSLTTATGSREVDLATMTNTSGGPIIVPEGMSLIYPAGTINPALGTRIPFKQSALDLIDIIWPVEGTTMDPVAAQWVGRYWAMKDAFKMVMSPTPDAPAGAHYTVEVTGLFQPTPLSAVNTTTYLSSYYPELLEALILVFLSGWLQKNYGAQSDDPKLAQSFEQQYQLLLPGAREEEQRRRGAGIGWTSFAPSEAQPARVG